MTDTRKTEEAPAKAGAVPQWVAEAHDIALGMAAANSADKLRFFDVTRLSAEAFQYFEHDYGKMRRKVRDLPSYFFGSSRTLGVLNKLALSPVSAEVWCALERFGSPSPIFCIRLCGAIGDALETFDKVAITTKDQKAAAARIRTLALRMADELSNPAVESMLRDLGRGRRPHYRADALSFVSLAEAATEMADLPRKVAQPNAANARRLYFIRYLTNWIYRRTGRPMRSQVFALTAVFFEVDDLDPNALATLAPVRR